MSYIIGLNIDVVQARMDALAIPWRGASAFLIAERFWNERLKRRDYQTCFIRERAAATRFPDAEAAWLAFDRSGVGQRSDYQLLPYEQQ